MYVGRMFSPIGRNVFLCSSKFKVSIDDIPWLPVSHIYRYWRNGVSPELVAVTNVLLELISVHEGVFSLSAFDVTAIQQLIELICIN